MRNTLRVLPLGFIGIALAAIVPSAAATMLDIDVYAGSEIVGQISVNDLDQ